MKPITCCVCDTIMVQSGPAWRFRCLGCGTWASTLSVDINGDAHSDLDESLRETGLSTLREMNNTRVLNRLAQLGLPDHAQVLDVGSAHGWFVRAAVDRGWQAEGLEPDDAIAARSSEAGVAVRQGFFPDALADDETFDAICFNDVLEHLPDVRAAVAACRHHLRPGGLLSVNIPSTSGAVFTLGRWMERVGSSRLSDRLWQVGFPSPHLWYFDQMGLSRLCESEGLEPVLVATLPSVVRNGLWERAHEGGRQTPLTVVGVAAAWLGAPLLNHSRTSDIMHVIARKRP